MKAKLITKTYIVCPVCDRGEAQISHLFASRPAPYRWTCQRCRAAYEFTLNAPDDIDVRVPDDQLNDEPTVVVLALDPQPKPVYLAVSGRTYGFDTENDRYFYEEHTCPTNWIGDVAMILSDGDHDPHGLFRHVATRVVPRDFEFEDDELRVIVDEVVANSPEDTIKPGDA